MALPSVVVRGRRVILLSGFKRDLTSEDFAKRPVVILAEDALKQSAGRNPDAVAFGYTAGQWVAAA